MEYKLTRSLDPVYFEIQTSGDALVSGFDSFLTALFEHPEWQPGTAVIIDHRRLNLNKFQTDDVYAVSNLVINHKSMFGNGKWAFIISGKLAYGFARMWEMITEERVALKFNVFEERDKALSWIFGKSD